MKRTSRLVEREAMSQKEAVTQLLADVSQGDQAAMGKLLPVIYEELHQMAHRQLLRERSDHTLNTTALVHEAYLKLVQLDRIQWQNRAQFFAIAAQAMRRVLINYAVKRKALKRGGNQQKVSLNEDFVMSEARADALIALDEALHRLKEINERQHQVVECRFFGGLSIEEAAEVLSISQATVKRDWNFARAWLNRELRPEA